MTEESEKKCSVHQTNLNCDNVLQQIQVEKQEFKCIINLNTIVCPNNSKHRKKHGRKHRRSHSEGNEKKETQNKNEKIPMNVKEHENSAARKENKEKLESESAISNYNAIKRMVPTCSRRVCWDHHEIREERLRRRNTVKTILHGEWKKKSSNKYKAKPENKSRHYNNSSYKTKKMGSRILLSPISSSPLMDVYDNFTYEDISSISFETCINEKPMAYKLHHRHYGHVREHRKNVHESKLDTLIRRTKERERMLVERSRCDREPWFTSTPIQNEYSSADFPMSCSDMDISFNSLPTMVLETKHCNAYSPTSLDVFDNKNTTEYFQNTNENFHNTNKNFHNTNENFHNTCENFHNTNENFHNTSENVHNTNENFHNTNKNFHNTNKEFENIKERMQKTSQCFQRSNTERHNSPCSQTRSYAPIVSKDKSCKLHLKKEPTTDGKAYSPASTPKMQYGQNTIKREKKIKTEPLFTCAISPIYFQNSDSTGIADCKKENVKSEFADH